MYTRRLLSTEFNHAARNFPSILVTGPRQSGKTTFLLHEAGNEAAYISFDDPIERGFALKDPNGFLDRFGEQKVILDEIQYVPEILPYLKIRIDRHRSRNGKWLLTGSQQFHLMKNATESLAGRIAILELFPFSLLEMKQPQKNSLETVIWNGGYPDPSLHPEKRDLWVRSYIQTYIERDVRQLQNIKDLRTFELFLGLSSAHHGRDFNTATLSRNIGVSLPTIKVWAVVLEASFLCFFLPPYFRNYGKRLIKTPKLYYIDPALVCTLTRQPDGNSALSGPMGGQLFEGLIISEAVKVFAMRGRRPDIFFWRSHDGLEVDLIIQIKNRLYPVEIKLTATPTLRHLEPLNRFKAIAGDDASKEGLLVCRVKKITAMPNNNTAIPWCDFPEWLQSKFSA
jgi:predicted AAA+ superfamily ATPase